jgi:hypothetical protein
VGVVEDDEHRAPFRCFDEERERAGTDGEGIGFTVLQGEGRSKRPSLGLRDLRKQVENGPEKLVKARERELGL